MESTGADEIGYEVGLDAAHVFVPDVAAEVCECFIAVAICYTWSKIKYVFATPSIVISSVNVLW